MINIRPVREDDFLILKTDHADFWRREDNPDPAPEQTGGIYHLFTRHFQDTCFVAEADGQVIGYLLGLISPTRQGEAYIHNLAVRRRWRGQGIGRLLYYTFRKTVYARGARRISLLVRPSNKRGLSFYLGLGMHPVTEGATLRDGLWVQVGFHGGDEDRIIMVEELPPPQISSEP